MKVLYKLLLISSVLIMFNQTSFADDVLKGKELRENIIKRLPKLNHNKIEALMKRVGKKVPKNFYSCLCRRDGGGASSGVGISYHPEIIEPYDERYTCQHYGYPCMAQGYGCWRFPLPNDINITNDCIEISRYDNNSTIVDVIFGEAEKIHIQQNKARELQYIKNKRIKKLNIKWHKVRKKIGIISVKNYNSTITIDELKKQLSQIEYERTIKENNMLPNYVMQDIEFKNVINKLENGINAEISKALHAGIVATTKGVELAERTEKIAQSKLDIQNKKEALPLNINDFNTIEVDNAMDTSAKVSIQKELSQNNIQNKKLIPYPENFIKDNQGTPNSIIAQQSPALQLIRIKRRLEQYNIMYKDFSKLYDKKLIEIRKEPKIKNMINKEESLRLKISQLNDYKKELDNNLRKANNYKGVINRQIKKLLNE